MRRVCKKRRTHCIRYLRLKLLIAGILCTAILFNAYVDRVIRPTLMQLAEYEARSQALQVIHTAGYRYANPARFMFIFILHHARQCTDGCRAGEYCS